MNKLVIFLSIVLSVNSFSQTELWQKKFESKTRIESLDFDSEGNIYAGVDYKGIYKSKDNGNTWENSSKGLTTSAGIKCIVSDFWDVLYCGVTFIGHLYKGPDPLGVFRSTDYGETWQMTYETVWINSIVIGRGRNVYVCGNTYDLINDIIRSSNRGITWEKIENGLPRSYMTGMIMDKNKNLFISRMEGGLYKSTNGGSSWDLIENRLSKKWFAKIVTNSTGLLIARIGDEGLVKSTDEGETWQKIEYPGDTIVIHDFILTDEGDIYLVSNDIGLQYFKNGDSQWKVISPNEKYQISTVIRFDKDGYLWAVRMLGNKDMEPFPFYEPVGYELYRSKKKILNED